MTTGAILVACGVVVAVNWSKFWPPPGPEVPKQPVSLEGATLMGDPAAPIVLIEWSDYQCPYCARAQEQVLPAIEAAYIKTGRVQLAFRHNPLESIHPHAAKAAEAALCARRQGRFWEMNTELFRASKTLGDAALTRHATAVGLDVSAFSACLQGRVTSKQVAEDAKQATELGLTGTPAFLIGRRQVDGRVRITAVLLGSRAFEVFVEAIEDADKSTRTWEPAPWVSVLGVTLAVAVAVWTRRRWQSARMSLPARSSSSGSEVES